MNSLPLRCSLLIGVAYFCCMSVAHFFGLKQPMLFVYYDTPFYAYQDKIISFCAFAYAMFAFAALRARAAVVPFIIAMVGVVVGLSLVNLSPSLREVIGDDASTVMYWAQTALLALIILGLVLLFNKSEK